MQMFIGTKIVKAEPCDSLHEGEWVPGYKVRCEDGYESWSPKDVFEEAYRPTDGMNFGLALEAAKKGKRIARAGWNGKGQWVELGKNFQYERDGEELKLTSHEDIGSQAMVFCGTRGRQVGWLASQADMLADDWMVLD